MKRRSLLLGGLAATSPLLTATPAGAAASDRAPSTSPLTNLAHLDFLRQDVTPPPARTAPPWSPHRRRGPANR